MAKANRLTDNEVPVILIKTCYALSLERSPCSSTVGIQSNLDRVHMLSEICNNKIPRICHVQ